MPAIAPRDAIQPHGAVLVFDVQTLRIQAASVSTLDVIGCAAETLLGQQTSALFTGSSMRRIATAVARRDGVPAVYSVLTLRESKRSCYGWLHVRDGMAILDLERYRLRSAEAGASLISGLDAIAEHAHADRQLDEIVSNATDVIRQTFGFERVLLVRLDDNLNGRAIAESRAPEVASLIGLRTPAAGFFEQAMKRQHEMRALHIPDVNCVPSPVLRAPGAGGIELGRSAWRLASSPQLKYLRSIGVNATLSGALIVRGALWGIMECQQLRGPKHVQSEFRLAFWRMCKEVSRQISDLHVRRSRRAANERAAALETLAACVEDGNLESLTADGHSNLVLSALRADGFALLTRQRYLPLGAAPGEADLRRMLVRLQAQGTSATTSLAWPADHDGNGADIAGLLLACLRDSQDSKLMWFRRRIAENDDFSAAQESPVSAGAAPWSDEEQSFAESLRNLIQIRRERRLQTELQFLQRITANSNVGISIAEDLATPGMGRRIVMVSEAFERDTGYSAAEVLGNSPRFLLGPDSGAALHEIREQLARGERYENEALIYRKDGSTFWADLKISPIVDAYGTRTHWMTVHTDVSERRSIRFGLEQQNKALEVSLSETAALAQAKSTLLGQVGRELQGPLAIMLAQTEMAQQIAESPRVKEALSILRGSTRQLLDVVNTILDAAQFGGAAPVVGHQDAGREHHRKATFFAAASHDLLQPLNAARIYASALSEQAEISGPTREIAQRIDRALIAAEEIIDVLVEVTKLDSGGMAVEVESFELCPQLEILAAQMSSLATSRHLQLRIRPCQWLVRSDRRLLRRVVQNLMANALRYTAKGGVLVGTRKRGEQLVIEVWDTGIGIDEAHRSKIFEEFSRVNQRSPWGDRGSGLGLAICERICRLLGHPLWVESTPGRGSCFRIAVPLVGQQSTVAAQPSEAASAPKIDGLPIPLNILCIDDDPDILRSMRVLLGGWGVRVQTAEDGAAALAALADFAPDVLLVDQQLGPNELGIDLLRDLRLRLGTRLIGAVLVTADHSDELRERCQNHGIHLLYKPTKAVRLRGLMTHFAELAAGRG